MPTVDKPHDGHRSRLRERFIKEGIDAFEEHNILELLLFYAIPQRDTNELAHELLTHFGTLEGVLQADVEQLTGVKGVGLYTARFITRISDMVERYLMAEKNDEILEGTENIISYAFQKLSVSDTEELAVFLIDNKQTLLSWHILQYHAIRADKIDYRLLLSLIIDTNATHILVVHKYTRDKSSSSKTDNCIAARINDILMTIGVGMIEYIVIRADNTCESILS